MTSDSNGTVNLTIPPRYSFDALGLRRDPASGTIQFRMDILSEILEHNKIELVPTDPDYSSFTFNIIMHWYCAHMHRGGKPNPVMEALMTEIMHEDAHGSMSFPPGHA